MAPGAKKTWFAAKAKAEPGTGKAAAVKAAAAAAKKKRWLPDKPQPVKTRDGAYIAAAMAPVKAKKSSHPMLDARDAKGPKGRKRKETVGERMEAAKPQKTELTIQERVQRNKKIAKSYQRERLVSSFGASRDYVEKKWSLLDQLSFEEEKDLAPTRKEISRLESNLKQLTRKKDPLATNVMNKSLANVMNKSLAPSSSANVMNKSLASVVNKRHFTRT